MWLSLLQCLHLAVSMGLDAPLDSKLERWLPIPCSAMSIPARHPGRYGDAPPRDAIGGGSDLDLVVCVAAYEVSSSISTKVRFTAYLPAVTETLLD
mmetsp:Transcript_25165/g.71692  ORF Transcript_25165/g.71692 Transcript_25165/m.71692 type:complete len:96 (-) Transcript_25165:242-529(-)